MCKYVAFILLSVSCISLRAVSDGEKLIDAIEEADLGKVKRMLKKVVPQGVPFEEQKKALQPFLSAAHEAIDERKDTLSFTNNSRDLSFFIAGIGFIAASLVGAGATALRLQNKTQWYGVAGVSSLAGLYLMIKGLSCSTQYGLIREARKVEDAVEDVLSDLEKAAQKK